MQYDYGFRIYDPRIGRFFSVDPLFKDYPELTPFQFSSNTPIWASDLDGREGIIANPMGGENVISGEAAVKFARGYRSWASEPAALWMKKGLAAQMNAIQPTEVYNVNSFDGMTKGQYVAMSMAQAQINHGSPIHHPSIRTSGGEVRVPQKPAVTVEAPTSRPKL